MFWSLTSPEKNGLPLPSKYSVLMLRLVGTASSAPPTASFGASVAPKEVIKEAPFFQSFIYTPSTTSKLTVIMDVRMKINV